MKEGNRPRVHNGNDDLLMLATVLWFTWIVPGFVADLDTADMIRLTSVAYTDPLDGRKQTLPTLLQHLKHGTVDTCFKTICRPC